MRLSRSGSLEPCGSPFCRETLEIEFSPMTFGYASLRLFGHSKVAKRMKAETKSRLAIGALPKSNIKEKGVKTKAYLFKRFAG